MRARPNRVLAALARRVPAPVRELSGRCLQRSAVTLERPVFIWGTGRSGTHLLFDIMSLHPDFCFVHTFGRWKKGLWGDMHHGEATPPALQGRPVPVEGMKSVWEPAGLCPKFHGIWTREEVHRLDGDTVRHNYAALAADWKWRRSPKLHRLLDKTPAYIMMVEAIETLFPDAYHLFCIRDPRAVANSILRLARFSGKEAFEREYTDGFFAHMYPPGYESLLGRPLPEVVCWQVEQLILLGFRYRALLGDRLIPFRYEELLSGAHGSTERLHAEVCLDPMPEIRELIPNTFPDYSPPWPTEGETFTADFDRCFSSDELKYFGPVQRLAIDLGYDERRVGAILGPMSVEG